MNKHYEIVFVRNGLTGGGLGIMCNIQANFFYEKGFDVTIIIDVAYSDRLLNSKIAQELNKGIKIIPALTSAHYLNISPQVKRKSKKKKWFGGTISTYYDEYGVMIKKAWHDSNNQRVKIKIPIMEKYLSSLSAGDIVIAMEASLLWYVGNIKLPAGVSSISQIHNQHFFLSDWIDNIENYTTLVCQTEKTKKTYQKLYGIKKNITIIPNPLRTKIPDFITSHNDRGFKIISVGHLSEGKQPFHAIEAFKEIVQIYPKSTLEFYGKGRLQVELEVLVKNLNLKNSVFFRGYESNLSKIFSDASLMLFPSKRESFGLVILEAFSHGVPVIGYTTTFGVDDLIDNGKNGYIVPQGDTKKLAEKAINLLGDISKRNIFASNGYDKTFNYQYDKIMFKWFELIKETSSVSISEINMKYNLLQRMSLPERMFNTIINQKYSISELEDIIIILMGAKAEIVEGKAYIYSEELVDKYNMILSDCEIT